MSAIQDIQPNCDRFQNEIRMAKNRKGYTIQRLIEESGVSQSAVNNITAAKQKSPLLYNSVGLCKVLDLSLDELFDLRPNISSDKQTMERIHKLESENEKLQALNKIMREGLNARRKIIYSLISICVMLLCALIGFVALDIAHTTEGIFRRDGISMLAVVLVSLIIASLGIVVWSVISVYSQTKREGY